jgi:hypothetical protein
VAAWDVEAEYFKVCHIAGVLPLEVFLMPFVTKQKREVIDKDFRFAEDKGDFCYAIYKDFVNEFKKEPRWTTIHNIYKTKVVDTLWMFKFRSNDKFTHSDAITALHLAWQVFFYKYVMDYEKKKILENGDI